jgi:DNA-binding beta-propeller fold protein YncE
LLLYAALSALALALRAPALLGATLGREEAGYALDAWRLLTGGAPPGEYYRAAPGFVQLLDWSMLTLGASGFSARLPATLSGVAAVLLCAPLGRALGRRGAALAALLLAVSPLWVGLGGLAAPDATAVALCLLGAGLAVSRHLWPWSLAGAAGVAGALVGFGATGAWLSAGLLLLLVVLPGRPWRPARALAAVGAWSFAAAAAITALFTRPPATWPAAGPGSAPHVGTVLWNQAGPLVVFALGVAFALASWLGRRGREFGWRGALLGFGALAGVVAAALPLGSARPSPAAPALALTLAGAALLGRAPGRLAAALAVALALGLSALPVLAGAPTPVVSAPGGPSQVAPEPPELGRALDRVQRVSLELYRMNRSLVEPRGGRGLHVAVAPSLASWGLWSLRELQNVEVEGRQPEASAEVRVLPAAVRPGAGFVAERLGNGPAGVTLMWRESTWRQISPTAGSDAPPTKTRYGLLDSAPPGAAPGQLNGPADLAQDPGGNFYVVDQGNGRVNKYGPDGAFVLSWGELGEDEGEFKLESPTLGASGIVATREHVWVADTWNHRVQQFRPNGAFVRAWGVFVDTGGDPGDGRRNPAGFYGPRGIALGPDGLLYITDTGNKRVVVYTQEGAYVRQWGSGGDGRAQLDEPVGVAVDRRGAVYVADARNDRVQVFDPRGRLLRSWRVDTWEDADRLEPYLDLDEAGNVYLTDPVARSVVVYSPRGVRLGELRPRGADSLLGPTGLEVTADGRVYVVDSPLSRVLDLGSRARN